MKADLERKTDMNTMTAQTVDWFTFKTNMRLMVLEMIEPTVKLAKNQEHELQKSGQMLKMLT